MRGPPHFVKQNFAARVFARPVATPVGTIQVLASTPAPTRFSPVLFVAGLGLLVLLVFLVPLASALRLAVFWGLELILVTEQTGKVFCT